jgi:hypothetical protein
MAFVERNLCSLGDKQRAELSQQISLILAHGPVLTSPNTH